MDNVTFGDAVMQEEIFGPVLPMLPFDDIGEAVALINDRENRWRFTTSDPKRRAAKSCCMTSSGGACINDTIMQIANDRLPFGGVGNSGMGRYHGRDSFDAFSHRRAWSSLRRGPTCRCATRPTRGSGG